MQSSGFSTRKMYLFIVALFIICGLIQFWVLLSVGFPVQIAVIDSSVSNGILMLIGLSIKNSMRFYRPESGRFFNIFAWSFSINAIWIFITEKWVLSQFINDPAYFSFFSKSLPVRFFIAFLITGSIILIYWLLYTFEENRENEKRKAETEKISKDAELYKLRQQLQPHFLFNSLNSISSLTGSRPEEARHMIQQLADFLRGTLKNDEKMLVSLQEEFDHLQLYLDIEKVRFGHRLSTEVKHDELSLNSQVPQMLLQPIVENAIKFGLYDTTGTVTITIDAKLVNGQLLVIIQNPFDPQTSQTRSGTGFGLSSIQRRLYLLYARKDLIETKAENNLFTTTVTIPQQA